MSESIDHKDKHLTIRDLWATMSSYVDDNNPTIQAAKQQLEASYKAYEKEPEDYLTAELAVASAKSMIEAIFTEAHIDNAQHASPRKLHELCEKLQTKDADLIHKALHDIDDYTYWHREHEFDDRSRPIDE
ncbi:MAG: hypothetical protein P1U40_13225 [Coxiellaceae bacterium]|nr:hypothetical protein [Coxiellaceae bacterium]